MNICECYEFCPRVTMFFYKRTNTMPSNKNLPTSNVRAWCMGKISNLGLGLLKSLSLFQQGFGMRNKHAKQILKWYSQTKQSSFYSTKE